eukprot:1161427-Pelagomonas_calceolata.AAC.3
MAWRLCSSMQISRRSFLGYSKGLLPPPHTHKLLNGMRRNSKFDCRPVAQSVRMHAKITNHDNSFIVRMHARSMKCKDEVRSRAHAL